MSYRELAAAILLQSVKDHVSVNRYADVEAFWNSGWFQWLCGAVDLDPIATREHMRIAKKWGKKHED